MSANDARNESDATSPQPGMPHRLRLIALAVVVVAGAVAIWYLRSHWPSTASSPTVSDKRERVIRGRAAADSGSLSTSRLKERWTRQQQSLDPRLDGWDSEAISEVVDFQLKQIGKLLGYPSTLDPAKLEMLCDAEFSCGPLRPQDLQEVYRDESILVRRSAKAGEAAAYHSPAGLAEALGQLSEPVAAGTDVRSKFKTIRVQLTDQGADTSAYFQLSGIAPEGYWQINSTWDLRWVAADLNSKLRLMSIGVRDYEEVLAPRGPLFSDCTEAVLGHNASFDQQIRYGLVHWLKRIERLRKMWVYARNGLAVGDVNGDGMGDLYLCQPGGLPNRLYVQNADGTATDCSSSAGVDWLVHTSSAIFVDLDNDGDQDLVTAVAYKLLLMENDATGQFRLKSELNYLDQDCQSLSAVDYDNDGDVDLFLCVDIADQLARKDENLPAFSYHDARNGGANILFRNDISDTSNGWTFTDVTEAVGLETDNRRHSLAAAWEDYDNDGDQDLYVANDYGPNWLYRNDNGQFVNVAPQKGLLDVGSGMSVSWADYNRDGQMDLYVANMFSSAGNRITRQIRFKTDADQDTKAVYRRLAKGNTLFEGRGDAVDSDGPGFSEVGAESGVEMGRWAWSSPFVDLNNDGWEDIVVANGFHTGEEETKDL